MRTTKMIGKYHVRSQKEFKQKLALKSMLLYHNPLNSITEFGANLHKTDLGLNTIKNFIKIFLNLSNDFIYEDY